MADFAIICHCRWGARNHQGNRKNKQKKQEEKTRDRPRFYFGCYGAPTKTAKNKIHLRSLVGKYKTVVCPLWSGEKTKALANQTSRPIACPMLDPDTGACPVYAQRPVACRTYGFYAQRDQGLYCQDIKSLVDAGTLADVVWGNHDNIDRQLRQSGESLNLTEWFVRWDAETNQTGK